MRMRYGGVLSALACGVYTCMALPQVDVIDLEQDNKRAIRVRYEIGDDPVVVTVDFLTNGVSIGEKNFRGVSGDVNCIVSGAGEHVILWKKPHREWADHVINDASFSAAVTVWATNAPPPYLAVDLTGVEDPCYYVSTNALPYPIESSVWRTTKLLMRRMFVKGETFLLGSTYDERAATIPKASDRSGPELRETPNRVTFSDDFYIGVFEFTQGQYKTLYGSYNGTSRCRNKSNPDVYPLTGQKYNNVRGSYADGVIWPQTGRGTVGGYIAKLREVTHIGFDLPTEWQWEVACKAGVQGPLYSGEVFSFEAVYRLAWIYGNSAIGDARDPHPVGEKAPNSWGLYDMIGNATECMVNVYSRSQGIGPFVDPVGPDGASDSTHARRGGRFNLDGESNGALFYNRPTSRSLEGAGPEATSSEDGFRVICPAGLYW